MDVVVVAGLLGCSLQPERFSALEYCLSGPLPEVFLLLPRNRLSVQARTDQGTVKI